MPEDKDKMLKALGITPKIKKKNKSKEKINKYKRLTRAERKTAKRSAGADAGITGNKSKFRDIVDKTGFKLGKAVGIVDKKRRFIPKGGAGVYGGSEKKDDPKKKESIDLQAARFTSNKGEVGRSKVYESESRKEENKKMAKAVKEAGASPIKTDPKNYKKGVGEASGVYDRNKEKNKGTIGNYVRGSNTNKSQKRHQENKDDRKKEGKRKLYRRLKKSNIKEARREKGLKSKN